MSMTNTAEADWGDGSEDLSVSGAGRRISLNALIESA